MDEAKKAIESAEVPWSESIVMICTKCACKLGSENAADDLKAALKAKSKAEGCGAKVRVVTSSCLNVCPEGRMTMAVARRGKDPTFQAFTLEPGVPGDEVYGLIKPR